MERRSTYRMILAIVPITMCLPAGARQDSPGVPRQDQPALQRPQQPGQPDYQGRFGAPGQPQPPFPGQGFNGPGPFGPGPGMPMMGNPMMGSPMMPELAKKTVRIMALRNILGMRFTSDDIRKSLPGLRALRDSEKELQRAAEQALEDEIKALLAAEPDSPPPPDGGARLEEVMRRHQERSGRIWGELANAIGQRKVEGLKGLVGQGGMGMMPGNPFGGGPGPGFGDPGAGFGGAGGRFGGGQPGFDPNGRAGQPGAGRNRRPDLPGAPDIGPQPPRAGFGGNQGAPFGGFEPPAAPGQVGGDPGVGPPPIGPEGGFGGQDRPRPPQGWPGGAPGRGGFGGGGFRGGPGGVQGGFSGFMPPGISLGELVDLLEQKLAAMKR